MQSPCCIHEFARISTKNVNCGLCKGGVAGGVPPHKGGPEARPSGTAGTWNSNCNVKGKGLIHEFARISTKNVNCGLCKGGVAGGVPPHEGGPKARPSRMAVARGQWPVTRNQWPGTAGGSGKWNGHDSFATRGKGICFPVLDCTRLIRSSTCEMPAASGQEPARLLLYFAQRA